MLGFHQSIMKGTKQSLYDFYKVKYTLASQCIEAAKKNVKMGNVELYKALTHLAQCEVLDVNMVLFDYLQFSNQTELDDTAVSYIEALLNMLKDCMNKLWR